MKMISKTVPKSKKVLLLIPPNITFDAFTKPGKNTKTWRHKNGRDYGVLITDVPLGALTISGWLKEKCDSEVILIDFNTLIHSTWDHSEEHDFSQWFDETLADIGKTFQPDVIGFSSLFVTGYQNLISLGNVAKKIFPAAFRIVGGNVATTMYRELLHDEPDAFNALCFGEGELPLLELFASPDMQQCCDESTSWITRKNLLSGSHYAHNFIQDLDDITPLDYSAISLDDYHYNPTIKAYTGIEDKANYITYMGSRGCPFLCTFCSAHTVHGRKMRNFSIPRIREELTRLTEVFNANTLVIEDDMFLWNNEWATEVLRIAQELKLNCFFPNALALYALDRKMLEELHKTGVRQLTLAVESGSSRVLKEIMKKPLKLSITNSVVKNCQELGIYTDCNIILGMPGETKADIAEGREFLLNLHANWYRINVATPLAGSEMYINAQAAGQIVGDIRFAGYKKCVIKTDDFAPDEVEKIAYDLNLELNFLNNTDMKLGNYQRAKESFENVLLLREDHALAMHCLILCMQALGDSVSLDLLQKKLDAALKSDPFWKAFFKKHGLLKFRSAKSPPNTSVPITAL